MRLPGTPNIVKLQQRPLKCFCVLEMVCRALYGNPRVLNKEGVRFLELFRMPTCYDLQVNSTPVAQHYLLLPHHMSLRQTDIPLLHKKFPFLKKERFVRAQHGTHHAVFLSEQYVIRSRVQDKNIVAREALFLSEVQHALVPKTIWDGMLGTSYVMLENRCIRRGSRCPRQTVRSLFVICFHSCVISSARKNNACIRLPPARHTVRFLTV